MRSSMLRIALITGLTLAAFAGSAAAQQGSTTGAIRGTVLTRDGEPVASAQVVARNTETGLQRGVLTGVDGRYIIPLLPPGTYQVSAQSIGFGTATRRAVPIRLGQVEEIDFRLVTEAVALEELRVDADVNPVDVNRGGVIERVNTEQIEELPVSGRDFTDFLNLSPIITPQPQIGTGGQFSIGGARASATNVQIDGADANNTFFGENRGSSRAPFSFSLESIREFEIITNGYDVEFGNFSGGLINAVTRGGTNELQASAFTYFRGEALTAEGFDGAEPEDFKTWQFGGRVGGPIVRDKAHFFVSVDAQQMDQPVFALSPVRLNLAADSLQRFINILENVYGLDASSAAGVFEETNDQINLFARVDWQLSDRHRLTLRNNYLNFDNENDRISSSGRQALTVGGSFQDNSNSFVAEVNSIFSPELWNVFRFQWSYEDRPRPGNSFLPNIQVNVEDQAGNRQRLEFGGSNFGILFRNDLDERKFQFIDNLSWRRGAHTFKVGTNNILTHTENLFWLNGNGFVQFSSLARFEQRRPSFFLRFVPPPGPDGDLDPPFAEFDVFEGSVYGQDDWQVNDRLLLSLGLRYDWTSFLDEGEPLPILADSFGVSTATVPEDRDNIAPRVALAYDIGGEGRQVFRAGAGLFFGRVPTVLHGNVLAKIPPLETVGCFSAGIDTDFASIDPLGENIQRRCINNIGFVDQAGVTTVWSEDFEMPRTLKANIGYEGQIIDERTRFGIDLIFSRTDNNFSIEDLNLRDPQFVLASGRPVHVPEQIGTDRRGNPIFFDPTRTFRVERRVRPSFDRVFLQNSEAEARAVNAAVNVQRWITEELQFGLSYGLNFANDNSSFSCCTENEGLFGVPTAGNPNFIGDFGEDFQPIVIGGQRVGEVQGTWGPSDFGSRHVVVANFLWNLPWKLQFNGIYRGQSGRNYTPIVLGDVNGDADDENDRAYIPDLSAVGVPGAAGGGAVILESQQDIDLLRGFIAEHDCLADAVGTIIERNECTNPWFHRLDLRFSRPIETWRGQRAEILVDLFNVLDGVNNIFCDTQDTDGFCGLGRWVVEDNQLLTAEGYDEASDRIIYSVQRDFAEEDPVGFEPFQFQAQIGIRYRF